MSKRILLGLIILVLLLGAGLIAVRLLNRRAAPAASPPAGVEGAAGLPESGLRELPAPTPPSSPLSPVCPEHWQGLPDADSDELPDEVEALYLTDDANPDTDGDGYKDGEEARAGFDPLKREGNPRLDSDSDGLRNDEECAWKTDPLTADTDGDGFPDGDEVRNGFDPTMKGDGKGSDVLPERRARLAQEAVEQFRPRSDSENLTERLAAQILGSRTSEEARNLTVTREDIESALARLNFPIDTALPAVSIAELTVGPSNTPTGIRAYLSRLEAVRPRLLNDANVFVQILATAVSGNVTALRDVRTLLDQYEKDLLAISVPPSAVPHHRTLIAMVRFVNARFLMIENSSQTDPVRAHLALRELQEGIRTNTDTVVRLREELEQLAAVP